ncbi:MAG: hypothetical protein OK456_07720 [Thaumarchaeota archaeon]|nr:hypothetical protein [Nitrososphaerota archaeon]
MVVGRKRKRYVFLETSNPTDVEVRKELTRLVLEKHPSIDRKKMVWVERGLIVRTDPEHLIEMRTGDRVKFGETEMVSRLTSGSISKLKRMASGTAR